MRRERLGAVAGQRPRTGVAKFQSGLSRHSLGYAHRTRALVGQPGLVAFVSISARRRQHAAWYTMPPRVTTPQGSASVHGWIHVTAVCPTPVGSSLPPTKVQETKVQLIRFGNRVILSQPDHAQCYLPLPAVPSPRPPPHTRGRARRGTVAPDRHRSPGLRARRRVRSLGQAHARAGVAVDRGCADSRERRRGLAIQSMPLERSGLLPTSPFRS